MKKVKEWICALLFIGFVVAVVVLVDFYCSSKKIVETSTLFTKNDYEKTILTNGGTEFEKVFFGNSVLISAFIEKNSTSSYVNAGLDYGTMEDIYGMLKKNYITVKKDAVIIVNPFVLLDVMDTNPTYPWHRKKFEPYLYFQRDRIQTFIENYLNEVFLNGDFSLKNVKRYENLNKYVYYGVLNDAQLDEKVDYYRKNFWCLDESNYKNNLNTYKKIIEFCKENKIRLRVIEAPWNNYVEMPSTFKKIMDTFKKISLENNIEVLDLTNKYSREYFHDLGHLNFEFGAVNFTKEIDTWLKE